MLKPARPCSGWLDLGAPELLEDLAFRDAIAGAGIPLAPDHRREAGYCDELFAKSSPR
jgi:hypothetical protein